MHLRWRAWRWVLTTAMLSAALSAQSPRSSDATALEVASIRLNTSLAPGASISVSPGGPLTLVNVTFRDVIQRAYGNRLHDRLSARIPRHQPA